jgi:DNA repair protein RadD
MKDKDASPLDELADLAAALDEAAAAPPARGSGATAKVSAVGGGGGPTRTDTTSLPPSWASSQASASASPGAARSSAPAPGVELRDYQDELVTTLVHLLRRKRRDKWRHTMVYLPTGAGKTVVAGTVIARHLEHYGGAEGASDKENAHEEEPPVPVRPRREAARCLFVVNRCTLVEQTARALSLHGLSPGFIKAGLDEEPGALVQIATIQTLLSARRRERRELGLCASGHGGSSSTCSSPSPPVGGAFELIVVDEAHCVLAPQYADLLRLHPGACVIGLTATPFRLGEGERLSGVFGKLLRGPSVSSLLKKGHLVPPVVLAPSTAPFSTLSSKVAQSDAVLDSAVRRWCERCAGRRTIAFCYTVRQSEALVTRFRSAGVRAFHVDGTTREAERELRFRSLAEGDALVLSSVGVLSEGFDLPAVEVVLLLRPTDSKGLFLQQVGRGLRCAEGKRRCIVLDEVGNSYRHGPIDGPLCASDWDSAHVLPLEGHPEEDQRKAKAKGESLRDKLLKFCMTKGCFAFIDKRSDRMRCALCRDAAAARRERESRGEAHCEAQIEVQADTQREAQLRLQASADAANEDGRAGLTHDEDRVRDRADALKLAQRCHDEAKQQPPRAEQQLRVQQPAKQMQQQRKHPATAAVPDAPERTDRHAKAEQVPSNKRAEPVTECGRASSEHMQGTQARAAGHAKGNRASSEHMPGKQVRAERAIESSRASGEHVHGTQERAAGQISGHRASAQHVPGKQGSAESANESGRATSEHAHGTQERAQLHGKGRRASGKLAAGASRHEQSSKAQTGCVAPREHLDEVGELGALLASKLQV